MAAAASEMTVDVEDTDTPTSQSVDSSVPSDVVSTGNLTQVLLMQ